MSAHITNVSPQHLDRYLAEFDYRYNERAALEVDDAPRMEKSVGGIVGNRLIYQRTFAKANQSAHKSTTGPKAPKAQEGEIVNSLYYGDNLDVLRKKIRDHTVDLCYIDPPFNSKRTYNQIYTNVGSEDRAQARAFIDTWKWDDFANAGYPEITGNDQGRFTP